MKKLIKEKTEDQKFDFGCLMCKFDIPNWKQLVEKLVDKNDVFNNEANEYGIEEEPHCTILYGFHDNVNHEQLKPFLMPTEYIKVEFNKIDVFKNELYDVLKFNVSSEALNTLNKVVKATFDHTTGYPSYEPHCTIAYLKPGTGAKYIKKLSKPFTIIPSEYKYSYASGQKENFDVDPFPETYEEL